MAFLLRPKWDQQWIQGSFSKSVTWGPKAPPVGEDLWAWCLSGTQSSLEALGSLGRNRRMWKECGHTGKAAREGPGNAVRGRKGAMQPSTLLLLTLPFTPSLVLFLRFYSFLVCLFFFPCPLPPPSPSSFLPFSVPLFVFPVSALLAQPHWVSAPRNQESGSCLQQYRSPPIPSWISFFGQSWELITAYNIIFLRKWVPNSKQLFA